MALISTHDSAARVRAVKGFLGLEWDEFGELVGIPNGTLRGYGQGKKVPEDKLRQIAERAGVPVRFMLEGFEPLREAGLQDQIDALWRIVKLIAPEGVLTGLTDSPQSTDRPTFPSQRSSGQGTDELPSRRAGSE